MSLYKEFIMKETHQLVVKVFLPQIRDQIQYLL